MLSGRPSTTAINKLVDTVETKNEVGSFAKVSRKNSTTSSKSSSIKKKSSKKSEKMPKLDSSLKMAKNEESSKVILQKKSQSKPIDEQINK